MSLLSKWREKSRLSASSVKKISQLVKSQSVNLKAAGKVRKKLALTKGMVDEKTLLLVIGRPAWLDVLYLNQDERGNSRNFA